MIYRLATNGEKADCTKSRPQFETWPPLFQTTVCSYTVRRTQYDRLSQQQLMFCFQWKTSVGEFIIVY